MTQYEAVIEAMRSNGGLATLGWLYQHAFAVPGVKWGTKTPFKSINRIVQDPKYFFRIRPGLWALKELKGKLGSVESRVQDEHNHAYYQGLIIELGNLKGMKTFVPRQDRRKEFVNQELGSIASLAVMLPFTYERIVKRASTVDVVWFNERLLPCALFEVEHTTSFDNSLLKFMEFEDFNVEMRIVSSEQRQREFRDRIGRRAYDKISRRVKFTPYGLLVELHRKAHEAAAVERLWATAQ